MTSTPETRSYWQIEQGKKCGCRGADEYCPCQNTDSTTPAQPEALSEDDIRRRLIQRIEQWDGETEYDAEDIASLADDILHEFNGAPVLSSSALGYVSADAEAALKAGINRVIYPAPSAHASFPLYASPVPTQDDNKLRIAVEALERYAEQGYVGAQAALDKIGAPK